MQQSREPLLPSLKLENKVANFNESGVWDFRQRIALDNLSDSLAVEKVDPKYFDIDSIPSMWARPLLFEMALYDANHLLRDRILGEWRGLLAMLALKDQRDLPLQIKPVEIPKFAPGQNAPQKPPGFPEALGRLAPKTTLANDTSWHDLYVILFDNNPIGMTSPTTLVCTAADCYNRIPGVTWSDGRFLSDPTPHLNVKEKEALAGWLKALQDQILANYPGCNVDIWDKLSGLIESYQQDLGGVPDVPVVLNTTGFGMEIGIFRYLDKPVMKKESPSHVQLKPSRSEEPPLSLLVADRAIPQQWNMSDHEVNVGRSTTIASLPFGGLGSKRTQLGAEPLPQGTQLRLPEDFFTEKLFVINQQDAFPGVRSPRGSNFQYQGNPVTPILPITDELLAYLTVEDLSQRISFEQGSAGIVVKLRLPLSGPDGTGKDFEATREFRSQANEVIEIPTVPVLEIWPNFKTSDWKVYYTYFSTTAQDTFYAKPYVLGDTPESRIFENRGETEREITRTKSLPEAIICEYQVNDAQTQTKKSEKAGVLLIDRPDPLQTLAKSWTVGIDFGTTGTTVYANYDGRNPFPVEFHPRSLQVTASGPRRTDMYLDFLPGELERTPFLSIFQGFPKTNQSHESRPILDGHIYFLLDYEKFNAAGQGIATDLKWSADPDIRILTQTFLEQLCLQCAAEAVTDGARTIDWRFSFPTAFSSNDQQVFRQIWNQITDACSTSTGVVQPDSPKAEPESVVSARFFASNLQSSFASGAFATGAVCIDIGGETSDISIWQGNRLFWQTSLRFAGRHIFLDCLKANPDFLRTFKVDDTSIDNLRDKRRTPSAFYAQADALISRHGEKWLESLPSFNGLNEVKGFVQLVGIGLSGLYYYVGLLLQYLSQSKGYKAQMPSVYVAGNGSRIFHWLAIGRYDSASPIKALFEDALLETSGFVKSLFDLEISNVPKDEAAFGLVFEETKLTYQRDQQDDVLAGEGFLEGGTPCGWNTILTATQLVRGVEASKKLDQIEHFIQIFDRHAAPGQPIELPITLEPALMNRIYQRLSNILHNFKGLDEKTLHVEPLFIVALKLLLETKTSEWASHSLP